MRLREGNKFPFVIMSNEGSFSIEFVIGTIFCWGEVSKYWCTLGSSRDFSSMYKHLVVNYYYKNKHFVVVSFGAL
jgi:hypothetical protein